MLGSPLLAMLATLSPGPPVPRSPGPPDSASYWQQSVHYTLGAYLDEPTGILTGGGQLVYRNSSPDTLRDIFFHQYLNAFRPGSLWSADEVREHIHRFADLPDPYNAFERFGAVEIGGTAVRPDYPNAPDSTIAHFALPRPLAPGDSLVVTLQWTARPSVIPRRQGRFRRRFDFAQWYPKVCVYDRDGWQAHPLHMAGELYGEYGTYDVTLDLAQDQVVAATGVPVEGDPGWGAQADLQRDWYGSRLPASSAGSRPPAPGRKRVRFYAENIHHFAWSVNPEYRYEEGRYGDVVLRALYLPQDAQSWGGGRMIEFTRRAMAWLDTIYGAYPYPQTIAVHRIEDGGTEFPMLVMLGGASESVVFHEVGHIYTYGILGNNEWHDGWLDEGFTTFQTAWNFQRRGMGVPSINTQMLILNLDFDGWSQPIGLKGEEFSDFQVYTRMVYTKAQLFYEMLRYVVGEPAFRRGLRLYYDRWKLRHVDEEALRRAMEEVSGQNLSAFFFEWLHATRTVDYRFAGAERWRQEDGSWVTQITVQRKGDAEMPVDIAVPAGDTTYVVRAAGHQPREMVEIVTPVRSGRVELDPERRTMDWNYLNNRERGGPLGLLGAAGPKSVNRIGWSGSAPARRDRMVNNWLPLAWYNDLGGLNLGLQLRSNYLGRFDQNVVQLTWGARDTLGRQTVNFYGALRNPTWLRGQRTRIGAEAWYLEGRRGARLWSTHDGSGHLSYGPRVIVGVGLSQNTVTQKAYVDSTRWSALSVTELYTTLWRHTSEAGPVTDLRLAGALGLAGDPGVLRLDLPRVYIRATVDLRQRRQLGSFELRGRVFAGVSRGLDSLPAPRERLIFLAGADPYETFANPFLRSRGALLTRQDVNYSAPGGAGLRGLDSRIATDRVVAASVELSRPILRKPRRLFSTVSLALFGDVAAARASSGTVPVGRKVLADAGIGVRASHRIGPTSFVTRVDLPLLVSDPALAVSSRPGDGRAKFRLVWSLEEAF